MELLFTLIVGIVIGAFIGRIYEYRTQFNYRAAYDKLYKEINELKRNYRRELASKVGGK